MYMACFEDNYVKYGKQRDKSLRTSASTIWLSFPQYKQQQKILGLEQKWPTWNCWFWPLTTLLGMIIVDNTYRSLNNKEYVNVDILE